MESSKEIYYFTFEYSDGSRSVIRSSVSEETLASFGLRKILGHMWNLDTMQLFEIRTDAVKVTTSLEFPSPINEVEKFVRGFNFYS